MVAYTTTGGVQGFTVETDTSRQKSRKLQPYFKQVKEFLASRKFQDLCFQDNNIEVGTLINISITEADNYYLYGNNGEIEGLTINLHPMDGLHNYKCERLYGKPKLREYRIFFSGNYQIEYDEEWIANPLLVSAKSPSNFLEDECLKMDKISRAFVKWAAAEILVLVESPRWCEGIIFPGTKHEYKTFFAAQKTKDNAGVEEAFVCLVDNGRMLRLSADEIQFNPIEVGFNQIWKTNFNWFRMGDIGTLIRMK